MKLTKRKIDRIVALSERCFEYLMSYAPHNGLLVHLPPKPDCTEVGCIMDSMVNGLREITPCAEFQELRRFLSRLSDTELRELLALIFIGRGPWAAEEFDTAFENALIGSDRDTEISFIAANLLASDDLAEGFEKLNRARVI